LQTIADIQELAKLERRRIAKLAESVVAGGSAGDAGDGEAAVSSASAKKPAKSEGISVEIFGDESRALKKSAVDDVNITFLLWGGSQGAQLAGVWPLGLSLRHCPGARSRKQFQFDLIRLRHL
jgi:hypothetical protein